LLARAVAESIDNRVSAREALPHVAYEAGQTIGAAADNLHAALEETGYDLPLGRRATLAPGNCPFHRLAQSTALVCGVNLQLLRGPSSTVPATHTSHCPSRAPAMAACGCTRARLDSPKRCGRRALP
jgi:predicted ArsR family transcriptional regulator